MCSCNISSAFDIFAPEGGNPQDVSSPSKFWRVYRPLCLALWEPWQTFQWQIISPLQLNITHRLSHHKVQYPATTNRHVLPCCARTLRLSNDDGSHDKAFDSLPTRVDEGVPYVLGCPICPATSPQSFYSTTGLGLRLHENTACFGGLKRGWALCGTRVGGYPGAIVAQGT